MSKSMFSREVALRLEEEDNPFLACRALSVRARHLNMSRKSRDVEEAEPPSEPNAAASAMLDLAEGHISIESTESEEE